MGSHRKLSMEGLETRELFAVTAPGVECLLPATENIIVGNADEATLATSDGFTIGDGTDLVSAGSQRDAFIAPVEVDVRLETPVEALLGTFPSRSLSDVGGEQSSGRSTLGDIVCFREQSEGDGETQAGREHEVATGFTALADFDAFSADATLGDIVYSRFEKPVEGLSGSWWIGRVLASPASEATRGDATLGDVVLVREHLERQVGNQAGGEDTMENATDTVYAGFTTLADFDALGDRNLGDLDELL